MKKSKEGICEMCGHSVAIRQRAHIAAEGKKSGNNLLMLCPSCHIMFDTHLKPKVFKALKELGVKNLPKTWKTSIYEQAVKPRKMKGKGNNKNSKVLVFNLKLFYEGVRWR